MNRRSGTSKTQIEENPFILGLQNDYDPILSLDHTKNERGEGLRSETPGPRESKPESISSEEYISPYDYRKDPLILRDLLKKLRRENPKASILKVPNYPLYSPNVKIYKLDRNKMFKRCLDE